MNDELASVSTVVWLDDVWSSSPEVDAGSELEVLELERGAELLALVSVRLSTAVDPVVVMELTVMTFDDGTEVGATDDEADVGADVESVPDVRAGDSPVVEALPQAVSANANMVFLAKCITFLVSFSRQLVFVRRSRFLFAALSAVSVLVWNRGELPPG